MDNLHCVLLQTDIAWRNPQANRSRYAQAFRHLPEMCDLLVLPEMCMTGFDTGSSDLAEEMGGESCTFFREQAQQHGTAIAAGLAIREHERTYNRFLWTFPDGRRQHYDKRHLFRMGCEPELYTAGSATPVIRHKGWNILPQTCYDLRFPNGCRNRCQDGTFLYDLLVVAANWPAARKEAMQTLAKARAIENQAYVLLVNRTGTDGNGIHYSGGSLIIGFKGEVLAELPENGEGFLSATLSLESLCDFREKFPVWMDWDDEIPAQ